MDTVDEKVVERGSRRDVHPKSQKSDTLKSHTPSKKNDRVGTEGPRTIKRDNSTRGEHQKMTQLTDRARQAESGLATYDVAFRGAQTLEKMMQSYEKQATDMKSFVESRCSAELNELKKAEERLHLRLKKVMDEEEYVRSEDSISESSVHISNQMRKMQRELSKIEDSITTDDSLSRDQRDVKLDTLHRAALTEYSRLCKKYPAAMQAQMLQNIRMLH